MSYAGPGAVQVSVEIAGPRLEPPTGSPAERPEEIVFQEPVELENTLRYWAVPISAILSSPQQGTGGPQIVQTTDGPAEVVHRTSEHFITNRYHKFAVGAGSTSVFSTTQGVILVDAGVHQTAGRVNEAIADATFQRLQTIVGNRPIVELLLSHLHLDHTALVRRVASSFDLRSVSVNAAQADTPHFQRLMDDIAAGREVFRRAQADALRAELTTQRATWEGARELAPSQEIADRRWNEYVERQVRARMTELGAVQVELMIPHQGRLYRVRMPHTQIRSRASDTEALRRNASLVRDPQRAALSDPALEESLRGTRRHRVQQMDRYSTSYIVDIGNMRLLVFPDLRARDVERIMRDFQREAARLGTTTSVRVWDMTHHLQSGFRNIPASRLGQFTRQLHVMQRQMGTSPAGDLLVVSARHDTARTTRNPRAQSFVDPANVWLFESLGFRVIPAVNAIDVEIVEVLTSRGQRVTGVVAGELGHARPSEALLRRANLAIDQLSNEARALRRRMRDTRVDAAERETMRAEAERARSRATQIRDAMQAYTEAAVEALGRSPRSSTPQVQDRPNMVEPAAAEARALRAALSGFPEATTSSNPRFTSEALVIIGHEAAQGLTGEAREILEARNRVRDLRTQLESSQTPHETRARLVAELMEYEAKLEPVVPREPGASRSVLADELESVRRQIRSHVEDPGATRTVSRLPGTGELVETRILSSQRVATETAAQRRITQGLEVGGRVLGGVMVYQVIRSQTDLEERFASGEATGLEMMAGTTHNALGAGIGVRMMMARPVPGVGFVILSALDILQTAARDYETDEIRNTDVTYSVIRNALTLAAMGAGHLLIKTRHPVAMIAGFALVFVVDPILEALGVYNWLERRFSFLPSDVTGARQDLRELIKEYRAMVGTIDLLDRSDEELAELGVRDVTRARRTGAESIRELRAEARRKELEVLEGFEEAYDEAREGHGGLPELDAWRAEFLSLQHRVNPAGEGVAAWEHRLQDVPAHFRYAVLRDAERRPIRAVAAETLAEIEESMNLDDLSDEQIAAMDQWEELDDELANLRREAGRREIDHEDIAKHDRDIRQMLTNARYRLRPASLSAHRARPMFSPNSRAASTYTSHLHRRENSYANIQISLTNRLAGSQAVTPRVGRNPTMRPICSPNQTHDYLTEITSRIDEALAHHATLVANQPSPPDELSATALHRSSHAMSVEYPRYVAENDDYRRGLQAIYQTEATISSLLELTRGADGGELVVEGIRNRYREAIQDRREVRGFYTVVEARGLVSSIRSFENAALEQRLAETEQDEMICRRDTGMILNPFEIAAISEETLGGQSDEMTTLLNRIQQIQALEVPDLADRSASGRVAGIQRFVGSYGYRDFFIFGIPGEEVTREDNVLVGLTGRRRDTTHGAYGHTQELRVVPLNQAAIRLLGGPQPEWVLQNYLEPVELSDVRP